MYSIFFSRMDKSFDLVKNRMKEIINSDSKVVIIPWTFASETDACGVDNYFSGKKRDKYVTPLISLGIDEKNIIILNCYRDSTEEMIKKIRFSDILILPGGNPEMLFNKIKETSIYDEIRNYDKIIIGVSAGTELQLNNYFITAKNNYYKKFAWYKGLNIINDPFFMDVHSSKNYRYINKLKEISNIKKKTIYAIFDDGAIIYNRKNKKIELFGNVLEINPLSN